MGLGNKSNGGRANRLWRGKRRKRWAVVAQVLNAPAPVKPEGPAHFGPPASEPFDAGPIGGPIGGFGPADSEGFDASSAGLFGPLGSEEFDGASAGLFGPILSEILEVTVSGIKGKQIATGVDGIATVNLAPGVISADAAGRALFANGVLDAATVGLAFGSNVIPSSKLLVAGQTFDFSTSTVFRVPTTGANVADAATKTYVDGVAAGLQWKHSVFARDFLGNVAVLGLKGNLAALTIEGLSPINGDAYVVTVANGATTLAAAAVGDIWQYVTATWTKIVSHSGGFPPITTSAVLGVAQAPYTPTTDDQKVVTFGGASLTGALTTQAIGMAVLVNPPVIAAGSYLGSIREYSGTAWAEVVAPTGGNVPINTYLMVAAPNSGFVLLQGLVDGTDEGKIAQFLVGGTRAFTLFTSIDGDARLITTTTAAPSVFENQAYSFQGVIPTGDWQQVSGMVPYGATAQPVGIANSAGSAADVSRADHVHDAPAPTVLNKDQTPTAPGAPGANFQSAGLTITATPALDGNVMIIVNSAVYSLGDGVKTKDCYFSVDGGTTARAISAITAGDTLYWNGVIAGFDLAVTDFVSMHYEIF